MWKLTACLSACIILLIVFQRWKKVTASNNQEHDVRQHSPSTTGAAAQPTTRPINETLTVSTSSGTPSPSAIALPSAVPAAAVHLMPPDTRTEVERNQSNFTKVITMYNAGHIAFADVVAAKKDRFEFLTGLAATYSDMPRDQLVNEELSFNKALLEHGQQIGAPEAQLKFLEDEIRNLEAEIQRRGSTRP